MTKLNFEGMLIKATVESNSKKFKDLGSMLFATELVFGAKTVETSKTEFDYPFTRREHRASSSKIRVTEGIAAFKTAFAATWQNNYIDLPIFIGNLSTNSTETKTFSIDDLVYFKEDKSSPLTRSWGFISEGPFKVRKLLINYNLDQIVDIADTGATSTTTSTSTTSTSTTT